MARKQKSPLPVPAGVTGSGRALWTSTVAAFDMDEHELGILREACRTAAAIDALQAAVDRDGVLDSSPQGTRAHPALVELRQQRLCFARLVGQLAIPATDPAAGPKYGIKGIVGS